MNSTSIILTEKWAHKYEIPAEVYQKYKNELMKSPVLGSAITAGRKYLNYEDMAEDDVMLILDSTDEFVNELYKMSTDLPTNLKTG